MKNSLNKDKIITIGILPIMWLVYFLFEIISGRVKDFYTLILNLSLLLVFALVGAIIYKCSTKNLNGLNNRALIITFLILMLLDQGLKVIIKTNFFHYYFEIIPDFLSFNPIINTQGSWLNARFNFNIGFSLLIIINGILNYFGVNLTMDPKYGFWGLVILLNWQQIGYMMIIYIAGIQNIPGELMESAKIDGASKWMTLRKITIPLVMPSITICLFLTMSNAFKLFDQNLALTDGAPGNKTAMLALDIYKTFYGRVGWEGVGQAKAVIFFLIVAVIMLLQLSITRKKEVEN